ncbi:MAG: hypothetical protein ABJA79_05490 [Parafilimonas sp.]
MNPAKPEVKPMEVRCLVDSEATYLCIPEHVANQLQLQSLQSREVILVDGSLKLIPYVGAIKVEFENRLCFVGAMVLGDQTLLGAIPMEDMDLVINPKSLQLTVNPESPNIARGLAM